MSIALKEIYSRMYLIRRAEEKICDLYPEDDMKTPMHMSMGQEAAPAAIAVAFGDKSRVVSTYRSHAPFLAQTRNVNKFFCELYGKINGTARGRSGSMHLADPERGHICSTAIVGAGLPMALGIAFASKYKSDESVAITYFGDGAIEEGGFWEALNAASLMRLPLLMVCEDNEYAVHTKKNERRGFVSISKIIDAFDCLYIFDDSNDAEQIYRKALAAKQVLHKEYRPVFMHIKCLRYLEHVGIRNDI
jgi:TPP-dependent pyruvate/acetoin dehydrogenase alpha subunit